VRVAELVMAIVMAVFSLYLMWKSSELPIGWLPGRGPGGGAFPFWLALGMLLCCVAVVVRWFIGDSRCPGLACSAIIGPCSRSQLGNVGQYIVLERNANLYGGLDRYRRGGHVH
jgi:hypothetical protein